MSLNVGVLTVGGDCPGPCGKSVPVPGQARMDVAGLYEEPQKDARWSSDARLGGLTLTRSWIFSSCSRVRACCREYTTAHPSGFQFLH